VTVRAGLFALLLAASVAYAAGPEVKVDDLIRAVTEDSNYKVRVQAALVLGKLGDNRAVPPLIKALGDANKTVRGIAASALGQLGDSSATDPLRSLLKRETDPFVKGQAEKALASLSSAGGGGGARKGAKIYVNFGAFQGGVKSAGPEASKILHEALSRRPPFARGWPTPACARNRWRASPAPATGGTTSRSGTSRSPRSPATRAARCRCFRGPAPSSTSEARTPRRSPSSRTGRWPTSP
jgi:hypothetical protein